MEPRSLSAKRQQAVDYAEKYAINHNEDYEFFGAGDCTNFASQVLRAGGHQNEGPDSFDLRGGDSDDWYQGDFGGKEDYSTTWTLARENHNFITQKTDRGDIVGVRKIGAADSATYDPLAPSRAGLKPGDLIYYKRNDGEINHVAIYVGQVRDANGNLVDVVDQHSVASECGKHAAWTPSPNGEYVGGQAQIEFVKIKY